MDKFPTLVKPIPIKERTSLIFIEKGEIDVKDGAFVVVDSRGDRLVIPVGGVVCLLLEPGTRVSHEAFKLAARAGTLLIIVGEQGVRLYSMGQPGGARGDKLLQQAQLFLNKRARLRIVKKMFAIRFKTEEPLRQTINQLRGIEGMRVKKIYKNFSKLYKVPWTGRSYDRKNWDNTTVLNRCLSSATSCLYGIAEAAIIAAGYAPSIGFLHSGNARSFVFDIADLYKFETVIPISFQITASDQKGLLHQTPERAVRIACRDKFKEIKLLKKIIPDIETLLTVGALPKPITTKDTHPPAFEDEQHGDDGHRS